MARQTCLAVRMINQLMQLQPPFLWKISFNLLSKLRNSEVFSTKYTVAGTPWEIKMLALNLAKWQLFSHGQSRQMHRCRWLLSIPSPN